MRHPLTSSSRDRRGNAQGVIATAAGIPSMIRRDANTPVTKRFILVALFCLLGGVLAYNVLGWEGYVEVWIGAVFRALTGGALGYVVSRYVLDLDLSRIDEQLRPQAGLSQGLLIGSGAIAVAVGV